MQPSPAHLDGHGPDPAEEAIHSISHSLALIAADLHAIRVLVEGAAPIARAYDRGGGLAAWAAARQQRKERQQ